MDDDAGGSESKGKAKATDEQQGLPTNNEPTLPDRSDALSRIAKSAAALPSALFGGRPGVGELPQLGGAGKGESSRSSEGLNRASECSTSTSVPLPARDTIKSRQVQEHIARQEASFSDFLDSTSVFQPSTNDSPRDSFTPVPSFATGINQPLQSVAEQQLRDGEDVVAILSTSETLEADFPQAETILPGDMSSLRRALFGHGLDDGKAPVSWDNALNFIPNYLRETTTGHGAMADDEISLHLGTASSDEAWHTWVDQWSRVLTGYQDEVWGDLGALVVEARAEVQQLEQAQPADKPPHPTALLRLRAILGHLRGG